MLFFYKLEIHPIATTLTPMITALHRKKLFPALIMLFALAGLSLSVIGKAFSHGVVELADDTASHLAHHSASHDGHGHSHEDDASPDAADHHDSGNHTHETADQLTRPLVSEGVTLLRQPVLFADGFPRNLCYRLERPPRALPFV